MVLSDLEALRHRGTDLRPAAERPVRQTANASGLAIRDPDPLSNRSTSRGEAVLVRITRTVVNPLVLTFAGRWIYAIVEHTGRRSGRTYRTPVVAAPTESGFFVPLPYGTRTDWCRNVLAAAGCTIRWQGSAHRVGHPEVVRSEEALPAFYRWQRPLFRMLGIDQFLRLDILRP